MDKQFVNEEIQQALLDFNSDNKNILKNIVNYNYYMNQLSDITFEIVLDIITETKSIRLMFNLFKLSNCYKLQYVATNKDISYTNLFTYESVSIYWLIYKFMFKISQNIYRQIILNKGR